MIHWAQGKDITFNGKHQGEQVKVVLRRHIFFLILGYIYTVLIALVSLVLYFFLPSLYPILSQEETIPIVYDLTFLLIALFLVYIMFLKWVNYYLDSYLVTNERLLSIDQEGMFHRRVAEADVGNVQDVKVRVKGFFATLIKFGNVRVQTASADSRTLYLNDVPAPYILKDLILKLAEKNRQVELHRAYTYRPDKDTHQESSPSSGQDRSVSSQKSS